MMTDDERALVATGTEHAKRLNRLEQRVEILERELADLRRLMGLRSELS